MSILVVQCANTSARVVIGNICLTAGSVTFPGLINHQRTQSLPLENPPPLTTDHSTPQPARNVKPINPQKCMYRTLSKDLAVGNADSASWSRRQKRMASLEARPVCKGWKESRDMRRVGGAFLVHVTWLCLCFTSLGVTKQRNIIEMASEHYAWQCSPTTPHPHRPESCMACCNRFQY